MSKFKCYSCYKKDPCVLKNDDTGGVDTPSTCPYGVDTKSEWIKVAEPCDDEIIDDLEKVIERIKERKG